MNRALWLFALAACGRHESAATAPSSTATVATTTATASAAPVKSVPCIASDERDCTTKCNAGDMESCVRFAETIRFGDSKHPRDEPRAKEMLRRACDAKVGKACYFLSNPMAPSHDADVAKAKPLIVADCDRGDAASCSIAADIAMIAKQSAEEKRLRARSADLYTGACKAGDYDTCDMAISARFDAKDWAGAKVLAETACDHGAPESCKWLASMYDEALGVPADKKRATELFAKACDLGSDAACSRAKKK